MQPHLLKAAEFYVFLLHFLQFAKAYVVIVEPSDLQFDLEDSDSPLSRARRSFKEPLVSNTREACPTRIKRNFKPSFGHMGNGSQVEIDNFPMELTYIECMSEFAESCEGIDSRRFFSECVTLYEHKPAMVRLVNHNVPFVEASIRVPISCVCRIKQILKPHLNREFHPRGPMKAYAVDEYF